MKFLSRAYLFTSLALVVSPRTAAAFVHLMRGSSFLLLRQSIPAPGGSHQALFMDLSYGMRKAAFGISDKEKLQQVASRNKNCAWVDVRSPDEIRQQPCSQKPVVSASYLLQDDCTESAVLKDLPDKSAHQIVFCAKGGRAKKACAKLEKLGYENVYNAGGVKDLDFV